MDPETPSEPISDSEPKPSIEITDESANTNASPMNDNSEIETYDPIRKASQLNINPSSLNLLKPYQSVSSISNMNPPVSLEALTELCVHVIVQKFKDFSFIFKEAKIPVKYLNNIATHLPLDLDLGIAAEGLVGSVCEKYWKRRCSVYPKLNDISKHRDSWKVAFFEQRVQLELENFSKSMEIDDLKKELQIAREYVFSLRIKQLLSHLDFNHVITHLPKLEQLDLSYGAQNLGTDFEFNLFGIHKSDCNNLSTALKRSNLKILQLSNNLMDTEKLNLLLTGIKYIPTLTTLDLSHNKIGDDGIKGLTAVLQQEKCQIQNLDLSNNVIGPSGAKALAGAIAKKSKLVSLNLRLNQIGNGAKLLLEALTQNETLKTLNLGSNFVDPESLSGLDAVLAKNSTLIELDLSCNFDIKDEAVSPLLSALDQNNSIRAFSVKRCGVSSEVLESIKQIVIKKNSASAD